MQLGNSSYTSEVTERESSMGMSNAERQRRFKAKQKAHYAALEARNAELEALTDALEAQIELLAEPAEAAAVEPQQDTRVWRADLRDGQPAVRPVGPPPFTNRLSPGGEASTATYRQRGFAEMLLGTVAH